jgi:hypothetical protein
MTYTRDLKDFFEMCYHQKYCQLRLKETGTAQREGLVPDSQSSTDKIQADKTTTVANMDYPSEKSKMTPKARATGVEARCTGTDTKARATETQQCHGPRGCQT